jgi:heme/copper-type cytochrome/quinol oxidase subunit 2
MTTWTLVSKPGVYRGQCAELCGKDHGFMPIVVEVKPKAEFERWLARTAIAESRSPPPLSPPPPSRLQPKLRRARAEHESILEIRPWPIDAPRTRTTTTTTTSRTAS